MILVAGILLVLVFVFLGCALGRLAAIGDEMMEAAVELASEEPERWWDDPEWEWPAGREKRLDDVIREMEESWAMPALAPLGDEFRGAR